MRAVLCSRNRHKARELERLLPGWTIEPLDRDDYPPETGTTYYENAVLKAAFGRDVTLVFSAEETAREVAETLARKGVENERGREGAYRFLTTGDPEAFRELGRRFLQLPVREVEHVTVATLEGAAA